MTQVIVLDPQALLSFTGTGGVVGIDLTSFTDEDFVSIACPDFPLSDIDPALSYVDLTSNPEGDFDAGPTDSVSFSSSTISLIAGDSEFRFSLSLLATIDLSAVTGIRFRIEASDICTFRATAIRCVAADWVHAPIDMNTLYNRASRPVSPNGALYDPYEFPSSVSEWPVLYRSDEPSSSKDPMPIDMSVGASFASGSLLAATGDQDYAFTIEAGDFISVPDDAALDFSGSFSLEIWANPSSIEGLAALITKWDVAADQRGYQMSLDADGQIVFDWTTDGNSPNQAVSQTDIITISEWNHIVVTFYKPVSGSTVITFYHNGENVGSTSVSNQAVASTSQPLKIASSSFLGSVDEVAVYPSALSAGRVRQHYQTARAIPGRYYDEVLLDSPEGYWRLDEAVGAANIIDSINAHDGTYSVAFQHVEGALGLGASTDSAKNSISLYFREIPLDLQTQLDVDGTTMAELDSAGNQLDYDVAKYNSRTQADLSIETQATLDGDTQFDIERLPDYVSDFFIEVRLTWYSGDASVTIQNANGDGQTFSGFSLSASRHYYLIVDLENNSIRARIYRLDEAGSFGNPDAYGKVFDSTVVTDDAILKRRKGRFGWYANFADGDAYLASIQPRSQSYGEVVTQGFQSITPVDGAQLQVAGSSDRRLFESIAAAPWGGTTVTTSRDKTPSKDGFEVVTSAGRPHQGIQTNKFVVDDFSHTEITFDLFFPSVSSPGSSLEAFLYGENARIVPLSIGGSAPDKWRTVKFFLKNDLLQSGDYRFMLIQSLPSLDTTWYIDRFSITARSLEWGGRSRRPDPWGMAPDGWTEFKNTTNTVDGGTVFKERGKEVQIRGKALRQNSFVTEVKTLPKYSELGRLYWPDAHPEPPSTSPAASISATASGNTATFNGTGSSNTGGTNVAWYWSFGDGTNDFGPKVKHYYKLPGTYDVSLTVTDDQGRQDASQTTVAIV